VNEREAPPYDAATLETLACEIGARPAGVPHFGDVAGAVRAVRREADALVVDYEYDPALATTLEAIVAAERACCPEIGWRLESPDVPAGVPSGPPAQGPAVLRLRVAASAAQLDALAPAFAPAAGASAD
jgi:hypothetical protein